MYLLLISNRKLGKGKGKVHSRTGHEGPEGGLDVQLYSSFNLGAR